MANDPVIEPAAGIAADLVIAPGRELAVEVGLDRVIVVGIDRAIAPTVEIGSDRVIGHAGTTVGPAAAVPAVTGPRVVTVGPDGRSAQTRRRVDPRTGGAILQRCVSRRHRACSAGQMSLGCLRT